MTRMVLYPYPRLNESAVEWSAWTAAVDGGTVPIMEVADRWDSNTRLAFQMNVKISQQELERVGAVPAQTRLAVSVACKETAITVVSEALFVTDEIAASANAEVVVAGRDVSEMLELRAQVLAPVPGIAWLSRRVIAETSPRRVALDSALQGFPTVAFSFDDEGIPEAPWRVVILADDVEAPFAHSVRLELNEDYPLVRELIDGRSNPFVETELEASITRVLIGTVARLMDGTADARTPDAVAAEAPDSVAAAAARAATTYLRRSLTSAVNGYRRQPERFEYALASGVGALRGR